MTPLARIGPRPNIEPMPMPRESHEIAAFLCGMSVGVGIVLFGLMWAGG